MNHYARGAFFSGGGTVYGNSGSLHDDTYGMIHFDASNGQVDTTTGNYVIDTSKIVYGKSDTVQPPSLRIYAWRRTA